MKDRTIQIEGMHCNHCVMSVRKHLAGIDGLIVNDVTIGAAVVTYDEAQVSDAQVRAAIVSAGFTPKA